MKKTTKDKYVYDIQPVVSAYKIPENKILSTLKSIYVDIQENKDEFVINNKCWIYAFNFALIRRYKALNPSAKPKTVEKFVAKNEKFLEQVEEITHQLKV